MLKTLAPEGSVVSWSLMVGEFAVLEEKIPIAVSEVSAWGSELMIFYTLGLVSSGLESRASPVQLIISDWMQELNTPWEICWWHQTGRCC